jgi:hypothetical protein
VVTEAHRWLVRAATVALADYRRWLPAAGYEGAASIGGSFYSDDIEDY